MYLRFFITINVNETENSATMLSLQHKSIQCYLEVVDHKKIHNNAKSIISTPYCNVVILLIAYCPHFPHCIGYSTPFLINWFLLIFLYIKCSTANFCGHQNHKYNSLVQKSVDSNILLQNIHSQFYDSELCHTNIFFNVCVFLSLNRYNCVKKNSTTLWQRNITNTKRVWLLIKFLWFICLLLWAYFYQINSLFCVISLLCFCGIFFTASKV